MLHMVWQHLLTVLRLPAMLPSNKARPPWSLPVIPQPLHPQHGLHY